MEDQEMLEKIAQSAQELDIPEALKPEQIKKRCKKKRSRYQAVAFALGQAAQRISTSKSR